MSDSQIKKEKKWLYFAIGLIVGFLISAVAFVAFAMIDSQSNSITKTIEHIYSPVKHIDTVVKYVTVVRKEPVLSTADEAVTQQDSVDMAEYSESYDEVDFSYTEDNQPVNDDVVVEEKMLSQKRVRVQCKDADFRDVASVEGAVDDFVIQQWSTPIKNRITYYLAGNLLQVKGISADKVEIIYYDQQYYLFYGGNYYHLRDNDFFERLGSPVALNPQK